MTDEEKQSSDETHTLVWGGLKMETAVVQLREAQDKVRELEGYIVQLEKRMAKWGELVTRLTAERNKALELLKSMQAIKGARAI